MIPTKAAVLSLLEEARQVDTEYARGWVRHSITVGDVAGQIATALQKAGHNIDPEKVTILGYLHDIGKYKEPSWQHPYNGYLYLKSLGYDEEYCAVCITHSFANNDAFCTYGVYMQPERDREPIDYISQHQFTLEEKLVSLSDSLVSDRPYPLEHRIIDVITRYGTGEKTLQRIDAIFQIKHEIDAMLGYNLYRLFPEIMECYRPKVTFLDVIEHTARLAREDQKTLKM